MRLSGVPGEQAERTQAVLGSRDDDRVVRAAFLLVLAVPLGIVVARWLIVGANDPFTRVLYPSIVVVHGVLIVGLWRGSLPPRRVGPYVFASTVGILVSRLLAWELHLTPRPEDLGLLMVVLAWFGVAYAMSFLVFGTRRGAIISVVGFVVLQSGMVISARVGMLADRGLREALGIAGSQAVLIGVVWVLARNVEALSAARATGELLTLQAMTDPLTGIANRRWLDDDLQRMIAQAGRDGRPMSVILIDLDHFKQVNDTFGHDVGDRVLRDSAARIAAATRDADRLGRWGGEEFLLLAPNADQAAARALAERCREAISGPAHEAGAVPITASLGVATLEPSDDARSIMRRADVALYTAKERGRNCVVGPPTPTGQAAAVSPAE